MEIEQLLNNTLEKGKSLLENTIEDFIEMLQKRLQTYELKDNLQKQYSEILKNDETIEYNVFSKVAGKDYTILSFQNECENIIKIPNLLLPKEINSRTVLNYKNGEFQINQEKTEINNKEWEKNQETEEILKEGRIYFVDNHRNDYTQVIAVDNGKTYEFNFMQPYIGRRLKIDVNEGEYIIAKDGKFKKFEENVKIQNNRVEEKIQDRIEQIKKEKLNREKNLKEGTEFVVKEKISDSKFIIESKKDNIETYVGLYTNTRQLEDFQVEGLDDIYCYKTNSATIKDLNEGDNLVTINGKIIKEGTENLLEDKEIEANQYKGERGKIYIVNEVQEDKIRISNINKNQYLTVKREEGINLDVGDFIKTKDIGYERYDGAVKIEDKRVKENLENLYNFIL